MFNKKCDSSCLDRTEEFYRLAGTLYDPRQSAENENYTNEEPDEDLDDEMLENF